MSHIHLVGGEKGGVGKSVVSRLLSQYFIDKGQPYTGLDADQSHPTLSRYYGEFTRPLNLDHYESIDQIMELAFANDQQVLVDLPAQSQRFLDRWIADNGVLEMSEESDINVTFWYVVDDGRDSVQLLEKFLSHYGDSIHTVLVKNRGRGADFSEIEALPAVRASDFPAMELPALHEGTMRKLDKLGLNFWSAANVKDVPQAHLSLMERQRVKVWLRKAQEAFTRMLA